MRAAVAGILIVVAGTGCPADDDAGNPDNYAGLDALAAAYKDAQCTHLAMCGIFPSKDACLAAEIEADARFAIDYSVVAAAAGGHVVYNGNAARECLDAIAASACDRTAESARVLPAACSALFSGIGTAGQICHVDAECVSRQCSGSMPGTCAMGVCLGDTPPDQQPAEIGETCALTSDCIDGAFCDPATQLCTELQPAGAGCTLDGECAYGLGCVGPIGSRTCGALPAVGQACASDGICRDEGTYCDLTADMCRPIGVAGTPCSEADACSPYYPCNGTCTQAPALGEACSSGNRCFDAGTWCDFGAGLCVAKRADGAACDSDAECSSNFCDFASGAGVCGYAASCQES
jgi:hypothetical protein